MAKVPQFAAHKAPSMRRLKSFRMPNGQVVDWATIRADYAAQIAGQNYTFAKKRTDLRVKRADFELVAKTIDLIDNGASVTEAAEATGQKYDRVRYWVSKGCLPMSISHKRQQYYQGNRAQVRVDSAAASDLGYFLGFVSTGRFKVRKTRETGDARFYASLNSPGVADRLHTSIERAFDGIKVARSSFVGKSPLARPTQRVHIESTNFAKFTTPFLGDPRKVIQALPDTPKARLAYTRALYDSGNANINIKPNYGQVVLMHDSPEVLRMASRTLQEQSVRHSMTTVRGKAAINVSTKDLPAFKRAVGFRDPTRQARLPG